MGKRTVITCDKCGKEWDDNDKSEQSVFLQLKIDFGNSNGISAYGGKTVYNKIWCRECIIKHGVHKPLTDEDKLIAPTPQPSIEDKIVEILNDLGFYQTE